MSNVNSVRGGYVRQIGPEYSFVDGYDIPFSPERHHLFMTTAVAPEFTPPESQIASLYETDKSRPAGWYDKTNKMIGI